ncbi:hypothetical protein [uncultured Desulfobacter sp.]|uniref:hypothetical protein n=1 Tax=uncultured Desulfobacter sp. TaxID=240139 RepID=UPI002AA655D8|nr:hypothetical protein [uncultured Desulfobacter sp.]
MAQQEDHSVDQINSNTMATVIREMLREETALVNNTMNWLLLLQGLLFAALGTLQSQKFTAAIVSSLGLCACLSIHISFRFNERAIHFILSKWDSYLLRTELHHDQLPPVWAGAMLETTRYDRLLTPRRFLPAAFAIGWIAVLIKGLFL